MEIPTQSPVYHATYRDRYYRQQIIQQIETLTKRPLFVYESCFVFMESVITNVDKMAMEELFSDWNDDKLDLLLHSPGGEVVAADRLIKRFRQNVKDFRVIVPDMAKSAAALIALSADRILMGPCSELGPADPFVQIPMRSGFVWKSAIELKQGIEFAIAQVKDIPESQSLFIKLFEGLDPSVYVNCENAIAMARKVCTEALKSGTMRGKVDDEIKKIAGALTAETKKEFPEHGAPIDAPWLKSQGVNVEDAKIDSELWQWIWRLHIDYQVDLPRLGFAKLFESRTRSQEIQAAR